MSDTHPQGEPNFGADRRAPSSNDKQARLRAFEQRLAEKRAAEAEHEAERAAERAAKRGALKRAAAERRRKRAEGEALRRATERERHEQALLEQDDDFARFRAQRLGVLADDPAPAPAANEPLFGTTPLGGVAQPVPTHEDDEAIDALDHREGNHRTQQLEARVLARMAEREREFAADQAREAATARAEEQRRRERLRRGLERGLATSRRDRLRTLEDEAAEATAEQARLDEQDAFEQYRRERQAAEQRQRDEQRRRRNTTSRRRRLGHPTTRRLRRQRQPSDSD